IPQQIQGNGMAAPAHVAGQAGQGVVAVVPAQRGDLREGFDKRHDDKSPVGGARYTKNVEDRIAELAGLIRKYRQAYYDGAPLVSDAAFDALEDELRALAPAHPALAEVGAPPV